MCDQSRAEDQARNLHTTVHNSCMIDRRLHVLRMVAACGTVTEAADVLHYTPSAVSQQFSRGVGAVVQAQRLIARP